MDDTARRVEAYRVAFDQLVASGDEKDELRRSTPEQRINRIYTLLGAGDDKAERTLVDLALMSRNAQPAQMRQFIRTAMRPNARSLIVVDSFVPYEAFRMLVQFVRNTPVNHAYSFYIAPTARTKVVNGRRELRNRNCDPTAWRITDATDAFLKRVHAQHGTRMNADWYTEADKILRKMYACRVSGASHIKGRRGTANQDGDDAVIFKCQSLLAEGPVSGPPGYAWFSIKLNE